MDVLSFIANIAASSAWPIVAIVALALLRRPVTDLLAPEAVTKLSLTRTGLEITRELSKAITRSHEILDGTPQPSEALAADTDVAIIARVSPVAAILTSAGRFEGQIRELVVPPTDLRMGLSHAVAIAIDRGLWDKSEIRAAREVVRIRDTIALAKTDLRLSMEDALRYDQLTTALLNQASETSAREVA